MYCEHCFCEETSELPTMVSLVIVAAEGIVNKLITCYQHIYRLD